MLIIPLGNMTLNLITQGYIHRSMNKHTEAVSKICSEKELSWKLLLKFSRNELIYKHF